MRLLDAKERRLTTFYNNTPRYAILSHTWGGGEVSYQDMKRPDHVSMFGYKKIDLTCQQAIKDGIDWVWIDTCCIDKSDSVELSEAINSMFRWYEGSAVCYVYLSDVTKNDFDKNPTESFQKCRWFTRGWTLQELLAPGKLDFYDKRWTKISDRTSLALHISIRTSIPFMYLRDGRKDFREARVAQRLSWASDRNTTREEDTAYCLLGLFDINLPLLYGEGDRAFERVQEEILRKSGDDSLLAWQDDRLHGVFPALAPSPSAFRHLLSYSMPRILPAQIQKPCGPSDRGIQLELPIYRCGVGYGGRDEFAGLLNVAIWPTLHKSPLRRVWALRLRQTARPGEYERIGWLYGDAHHPHASLQTICIRRLNDASPLSYVPEDGANWLLHDHFLVTVGDSIYDRTVAAKVAYGEGWSLMVVHLVSTNWRRSGNSYLLFLENQQPQASDIWLSTDLLSIPLRCRLLSPGPPAGETLDITRYTPLGDYPEESPRDDSTTLNLRIKQSDICFFGQYVRQIEIETVDEEEDEEVPGLPPPRIIFSKVLSQWQSAPLAASMASTTISTVAMTVAIANFLRVWLIAPVDNDGTIPAMLLRHFRACALHGAVSVAQYITIVSLGAHVFAYLKPSHGYESPNFALEWYLSPSRTHSTWNVWCAWTVGVAALFTALFLADAVPYSRFYLLVLVDFLHFWAKFSVAVLFVRYPTVPIRLRIFWFGFWHTVAWHPSMSRQETDRLAALPLGIFRVGTGYMVHLLCYLHGLITDLTHLYVLWTVALGILNDFSIFLGVCALLCMVFCAFYISYRRIPPQTDHPAMPIIIFNRVARSTSTVKRKGSSLGLNPWDLVSLCEDAWHSQESNR